jgi:hypothetical protein
MKILTIILSAGVVAGLLTYALFDALGLLGLMGDRVLIHVGSFVGVLVVACLGSAAMALAFAAAVGRAERRQLQDLKERLTRLEAERRS